MREDTKKGAVLTVMLTPVEMSYLAGLLGATNIGGIGDPFHGWLTEEIEEAWGDAYTALLKKGLIVEGKKKQVVMDYLLAGIVTACAWPELTVFVNRGIPDDRHEPRVFRLNRRLSVEQSAGGTDNDELALTLYEGIAPIKDRIWDFMRVTDGKKVHGSLGMDMKELWKAIKEGKGELPQSVSADGTGGDAAGLLTETISANPAISNLTALRFLGGEWQIKGIGFISGAGYLWKAAPDFKGDKVSAILSGCDMEEAHAEVDRVIEGMLTG